MNNKLWQSLNSGLCLYFLLISTTFYDCFYLCTIHSTEMKFACHYLADNINKIYCT